MVRAVPEALVLRVMSYGLEARRSVGLTHQFGRLFCWPSRLLRKYRLSCHPGMVYPPLSPSSSV
jgi:hypothetical protein